MVFKTISITKKIGASIFGSVVGLSAPATCAADTAVEGWHVVLHARSWHSSHPPQERWNEHNWGMGLRHAWAPSWAWQIGAYRNSLDRATSYGLIDWSPLQLGRWHIGAGAGLTVGGYDAPYKLAAGLQARYQLGPGSVSLRLFPKPPQHRVGLHRTAVLALELGWRLP